MKIQTNIPLGDAEDLEILARFRHQSVAELVRQAVYRELESSVADVTAARAGTAVPR